MTRSEFERDAAGCAAVRARVYEFLDGELAAGDRHRIDAHLSACPPCAGHFAFERSFLAVLERRVPLDQAPPELRERIRAALAFREGVRRPK